jgi:hypothetical protein
MPKKPIYQELAFNPPKSEQTLQEWLFRELRSASLEGRLRPGARLPSSRGLALGNRLSRLLRTFLVIGSTYNRPNAACKPRLGFRLEFPI